MLFWSGDKQIKFNYDVTAQKLYCLNPGHH